MSRNVSKSVFFIARVLGIPRQPWDSAIFDCFRVGKTYKNSL